MPVTVEFVVVENSHACVTVNLKSQREMLSCRLFYLPQTQHNRKFFIAGAQILFYKLQIKKLNLPEVFQM